MNKKSTTRDILQLILTANKVGEEHHEEVLRQYDLFRGSDPSQKVTVPYGVMSSQGWNSIPPDRTTTFFSMDSTVSQFLTFLSWSQRMKEDRLEGKSWKETLTTLLVDQSLPNRKGHMKGVDCLLFSEVLTTFMESEGYDMTPTVSSWEKTQLFTPPLDLRKPFKGTTPMDSVILTSSFSRYERRLRVDLQEGKTVGELADKTEDLPDSVLVRQRTIDTSLLGMFSSVQTEFYLDCPKRLTHYPSLRLVSKRIKLPYSTMLGVSHLQKIGILNKVVPPEFIPITLVGELAEDIEGRRGGDRHE